MAKRGGYGGMGMMPGNMNNLMKQAQKMQKQMEETTKALEDKEYEATAGGGVVKVKINGKKEVTEVHLDEEVVDKDGGTGGKPGRCDRGCEEAYPVLQILLYDHRSGAVPGMCISEAES